MTTKKSQKFIQKFVSKTLSNFVCRSLFLLLFAATITSCTDQGCIEADDFGEYQSQTLTVPSNASESTCNYQSGLPLNDTEQGSGLKSCFTSGYVTVTDESNVTKMAYGGCNGKQVNPTQPTITDTSGSQIPNYLYSVPDNSSTTYGLDDSFKNLCITNCIASCLSGSSPNSVSSSEPNWVATDQRDSSSGTGIQILPGAQISITATGSVTLSNSANYPAFFIPVSTLNSNGTQQNFKDANWSTENIFDVQNSQTIDLSFSGQWQRPFNSAAQSNYYYSTSTVGAGTNAISNTTALSSIYNGVKKLVAYTIPHPDGYKFDSSTNSEILGNKGTPLLPEPRTWNCDYGTGSFANNASTFNNFIQQDCKNTTNGYANLGYNASTDTAVASNSLFTITSNGPSNGLGTYGGPIRWNGDGITNASSAIFTLGINKDFDVISSTEYAIPLGSSLKSDQITPQVVGSQSIAIPAAGITITNNDSDASYMPLFYGTATCNSINFTLIDTSGNTIGTANTALSLTTNWNGPYTVNSRITLGPGQKIKLIPKSGCNAAGNYSIKFHKFHDIKIERSGFVRFSILNANTNSALNGCVLNGRILNTLDSSGNKRENTNSDFYEYDNFTATTSEDKLNSLAVPVIDSSSQQWSNRVYVRKGQTIRFSPISWNNTFRTSTGVDRMCGVGMVMQITPRPALLCKGYATASVTTNDTNCLADNADNGALIGCQAYSSECSNISNSSAYCPYQACQATISCATIGSEANNYTKSNCSITSNKNSSACLAALSGLSASNRTNFQNSCDTGSTGTNGCSYYMKQNAERSAKMQILQDVCYDLESYTGRVKNIPLIQGGALPTIPENSGYKLLEFFKDEYGNLEKFKDTNSKDTTYGGNEIYQTTEPIIINKNSRLRFMFLTNDADFNNIDQNYSSNPLSPSTVYNYSSLSSKGSAYNGSNGFKISLSGPLQFNNGAWLEARLCRETSNHSCRGLTISVPAGTTGTNITLDSTDIADKKIDQQPHIVEYLDSTESNSTPSLSSVANYKFDANGTLVRATPTNSSSQADCSVLNQGLSTDVGNTYYCHSYLNSNSLYVYDASKSPPFSDSEYNELNKLRLSFKIKDPETPNCIIPTQTNPDPNTSACGGTNQPKCTGIKLQNPAYQTNVCYSGANCSVSSNSNCSPSSVTCSGYKSGSSCLQSTSAMFDGYFNSNQQCVVNTSTNKICNFNEVPSITAAESSKCTKQFYCGSVYSNNKGNYTVNIKVTNPSGSNISNIIGGVIQPVIETMDGKRTIEADGTTTQTVGQAERIYTLVVQDSRYQAILSISMSLMLVFYGTTYLMGLTSLSSSDLINRCIKIALIYFFASPTGWYWFNIIVVKWFKDGTDYLAFMMASSFDDSPAVTRALSTNNYYDKSVLFSSVDTVFGMFFSQAVQKKISALLFASIFGWVYLMIIYFAFMLYVYAVGYAVMYYLTAQVFVSILFILGPIFFIFTLFNQTKGMFDNWLNQIIGFSLQQIFLLTTLAFFNMMMYEVLKMSLGYRICWDEVWTINIITRITLLSFWTIASLPPSLNSQTQIGEIGHPEGIPSLFSILFIWVIASLMKHFITFMTNLGASIGGSMKASDLAKDAIATINGLQKYSSDRFNDIYKGTIGEPIKRLDAAIFDSGEHAEKARKEREQKNRQNASKKDALIKAGNEAMSRYKRENLHEYSQITDEKEKEQVLKKAKMEGIEKKAKELGIQGEELKSLMKDKGLKYEGSNLLVAGLQAARQKAGYGGATLSTSIKDSKINTSVDFQDSEAGMKLMSGDQRNNYMKKLNSGEVQVNSSISEKVTALPKALLGGVAGGILGSGKLVKASATDIARGDLSFSKTAKFGESVRKSAGRSINNIKGEAKKIGGKIGDKVGLNRYSRAAQILEDTGQIRKMGGLTSVFRTASEKKQIAKKAEEIRKAEKIKAPVKNSATTLSKLSALNKGLNTDANRDSTLAKIDSAVFGAGGIERASKSIAGRISGSSQKKQKEKRSQAMLERAANTTNLTNQISKKENLEALLVKSSNASQYLQDYKNSQDALRNNPNLSADERLFHQAKIDDALDKDKVENGGFGHLQMKELEKQLSEAAPDDKARIETEIGRVKAQGYTDLGENPVDRANAIFQSSKNEKQSVEKVLSRLEPLKSSAEQSKQTFETIMSSQATKDKIQAYENLSAAKKLPFVGSTLTNAEEKDIIRDYKAIQQMKSDFRNLSKISRSELKNDPKDKNSKSRAVKRHENFNQKYGNLDNQQGQEVSMIANPITQPEQEVNMTDNTTTPQNPIRNPYPAPENNPEDAS